MLPASIPKRPLATTLTILALWIVFYASFTLFHPALLDDADSVHAEVAREMLLRHDWVTLYANGIRYLEKAPLLYWSMATCMGAAQLLGQRSAEALAVAARIPLALTVLALALAVEAFARRAFRSSRAGLYAALILLSSPGIFLFTRILLPDAMLCLWLTLAMLCFWRTEQSPSPPTSVILSEAKNPRIGSTEPRVPQSSRSDEWCAESRVPHSSRSYRDGWDVRSPRRLCFAFAACCALGVLTKGLIGVVFPIAIVAIYLLLTRGFLGTLARVGKLHPLASALVFLAIAAPWHILIALANPTQGHPGGLTFALHPAAGAGHWQVPLPTDGNVHGWAWFYFVNEQVLRYLNLRVPRDYDTVPLYLFWGLCLIWLMPWSAFLFHAISRAVRSAWSSSGLQPAVKGQKSYGALAPGLSMAGVDEGVEAVQSMPQGLKPHLFSPDSNAGTEVPAYQKASTSESSEAIALPQTDLLLLLWAAVPLLFFSLSTRQEYYVLPSLPALTLLIASWLSQRASDKRAAELHRRSAYRCTAVLLVFGTIFAAAALWIVVRAPIYRHQPDLAALLQQNPGDYAMSMGHFLDLNAAALGLFRLPLALAALSLFLGPLASFILRKRASRVPHPSSAWVGPHAATLALAAGAFGFLLAAHLGLQTFAPVLSSQQLAAAIAPQLQPAGSSNPDLIVIHQEYEYGSTLGFYLQRPAYPVGVPRSSQRDEWDVQSPSAFTREARPEPHEVLHILTDANHDGTPNYGRSSNLWYGSFFPDAPQIFETTSSLSKKWSGPQRIFLWQDLANDPSPLPAALTPVYVIAKSGGKEIVSNQPNRP